MYEFLKDVLDNMIEQLPMTVLDETGTKLEIIDINDVDYIENEGRRVIYHIGNRKFYQITNKSELEALLYTRGFDALDRPYLVNMRKIRHFDQEYGKVFFEENPTANSKYATVAKMRYEFVVDIINRIVANNKGVTMGRSLQKSDTILNKLKGVFQK